MILTYFIVAGVLTGLTFTLRNRIVNLILAVLFIALQLIITTYAFLNQDFVDSLYFTYDPIGILLCFVLSILTLTTFYHSYLYHKRETQNVRNESIYYAGLMALITSMTAVYFANHLGLLWAFVEATTLFVSVLIYHERTATTVEATWKYIFVCSLSIAIAFLGILFLTVAVGGAEFSSLHFNDLLTIASTVDPVWLKIAFVLIFTGFCAKIGLFPLHTVCVDAKTAAPTPVAALISASLINVGFLAIYRTYAIIAQTEVLPWARNILFISGLVSIAIAAMQVLKVTNFKRLFAFSSLEHMGIVSIAIAAGGVGYYAAILHIVLHSFAKAGLFYQIGQVQQVYRSFSIRHSGKYMKLNPLGALVILIAFFTITAIPPSGLFISEFMVFKSLFSGEYYFQAVLALGLISVIIFVFGKNLLHLLFNSPEEDNGIHLSEPVKVNKLETWTQFALFGLILFLGFSPPAIFVELIESATSIFK